MFKLIVVSDIHFGASDPEILYSELQNNFFNKLKLEKNIDMIAICGDYFDHKLSLTEKASILGIKFMNELAEYCNKNNILFRIIYGTKTHDQGQLENFRYLETKYSNFGIISHVCVEEINNMNILYVPEEYMNDQNEFYKEYIEYGKEHKYDFILGHGTWDVFAFENQKQESERPLKGFPVLKYNDWEDTVNHAIIFGHIHVNNTHKKLYYCGSFSRWCFGEEKDKGFYTAVINNDKCIVKFIKNPSAPIYNTISLDDDEKDPKVLLEHVNDLIKNNPLAHYRINIFKEDMEISNLNIVRENLSENNNIKLSCKNYSIDKETKEDLTPIEFSTDINENIKNFIKYKFKKEISTEIIQEITTEN